MIQESYPASALQSYPGGPAAWVRAMSAKATREGSVKSPVLGGGKRKNDVEYGSTPENAATGKICGKSATINQTERRYFEAHLLPRILTGEIAECVFEGVTLVLAWGGREDRCAYTPDFWVRLKDGRYELHEVKGAKIWDDSRVKFKVARELFPWVKFTWAQWRGGAWKIKTAGVDQTLGA